MFKSRPTYNPLFVEEELLFRRPARKLRIRFVLALVAALVAAGWVVQRAEASEDQQEAATAGRLLLTDQGGSHQTPALSQQSNVEISVSGMVARVKLKQQFRNDSSVWKEGTYVFPLPDKAAVNRMRIEIGERVIEGQIKEKQQAQRIYQTAKAEGKRAGLVSQQRPNLFTSNIANIGPYETVTVHLEYVEAVAYDAGTFSLRFPMTITPRYIPGIPLQGREQLSELPQQDVIRAGVMGWAANTTEVPDASAITPWLNPSLMVDAASANGVELTADLDMGMALQAIDSAYHSIISNRQGTRYHVRLSAGRVPMDQDFVLSWRPQVGSSPRAAVFSESVDGEEYGMLMMVPPSRPAKVLPRQAIYIIDTSGSMGGVSIRQARQSLLYALEQLSDDDYFNVIAFNNVTRELFPVAMPANTHNLNIAKRYVEQLQASGGTEMLPALAAALGGGAEQPGVRQVIFITDGAVGNEQALFQTIHQKLGSSRLFTVGIGSAPNSHFMRKAAQFGRGTFTHIGKAAEVEQKMRELIGKINHPVLSDIHIEWPGHREVDAYPKRIPDLYRGEPLVVTVKLADISGDLVVSGQLANEEWQQSIHVDQVQQHVGVATLWAREKIAGLLDQATTGVAAQQIREQVLDVALTHQLVSPYTSFVAVENIVSRPAHESPRADAVMNNRPRGQAIQHFAHPPTASGAALSFCWGLALILMALVLRFAMIKESRYGLVT